MMQKIASFPIFLPISFIFIIINDFNDDGILKIISRTFRVH